MTDEDLSHLGEMLYTAYIKLGGGQLVDWKLLPKAERSRWRHLAKLASKYPIK